MAVAAAPARALLLAFVATAAVALVVPSAAANHVQADAGRIIVFDHAGGNEWWVEVAVSGQDAGQVAGMQVASYPATESMWRPMTWHPEWGKWTASFHVPPGDPVKFRASWAGGAQQASCWFSHPQGVEACGGPSPTPTGFDATFTGVRGNEWWVQAQVASNGPAIAKVDVRLATNGAWGNWMPVAKQSWGWGSSYHITQGKVVQLRATASDGQVDLSSCRQWVPPSGQDAQIVACPGGGGTTPFDATFTGVKGNEWWVQANVAANEPLAGVAFRVNCEPVWRPLTKQSWGGWAPNYQVHIPPGSKVDFKATSSDGDADPSGGYVWTGASPTSGCALGAWPKAGSQVVYDLDSGVCGGGECFNSAATLALVYQAGDFWQGTCVGRNTHYATDGSQSHEDFRTRLDVLPLFTKVPTSVGATHTIRTIGVSYPAKSCGIDGEGRAYTVDRQEARQTAMVDANHDPITLQAWVGERDADGENFFVSAWDTRLGMVVEQRSYPRMSQQGSGSLDLVQTDAPIR